MHVSAGKFVTGKKAPKRLDLAHLVPWFIIGFLALVACRSLGLGAISFALLAALHIA